MNVKKYFQFDETRDFPYYNHNPRLSKIAWIVLLLTVPISIMVLLLGIDNELPSSIIFCFILLIPLLYFSKWDYKLLFRKPTRNEIILAVVMFIGYIAYAILIGSALEYFGMYSTTSEAIPVDIISLISLIFSMMGEELLKFIPLMFFMRLFYKINNKRDLSFAISSLIIMICFGLLHHDFASSIWACLLTQGVGTIFEIYGYYKTKNLLVPYISHILTDAFLMIMMMIGF